MPATVRNLEKLGGISLADYLDSTYGMKVSLYGKTSVAGDTALLAVNSGLKTSPMAADGQQFRNNTELSILTSASRTAKTNSADQTNYNAKGAMFIWDITAAPGSADNINLKVQAKCPVSATYVTIYDGGTVHATDTLIYAIYPGAADTNSAFTGFEEMPLPKTFRVRIEHSGTSEFAYTVGGMLVM